MGLVPKVGDEVDIRLDWKLLAGLFIAWFVTLAVGSRVLNEQQGTINETKAIIEEVKSQQLASAERGYINRAIAGCSDIINDGEIEITDECVDPNVVVYFPPSICDKLPVKVEECGSKTTVITQEERP